MRVAGGLALAVLVACTIAGIAGAGSTTIDYPDFSSVAGLARPGSAVQSGNALRLASANMFQDGAAWSQTPVDPTQSFESVFEAEVHSAPFTPADGMTFAIQSEGLSALGGNGNLHGYGGAFSTPGVSPSVAVDISLLPQILNGKTEKFSIVTNGDLTPLASAFSSAKLYGQPFWVWVDYDAQGKTLEVFVSQTPTKPATPLLSSPVDLEATVGTSANAYAGFTASTGAFDADFDLLSWSLESNASADTTPPTVTCSATPAQLWPPNNKLVSISTEVTVTDDGSGPAGFTLVSVTSNEGDAGTESSGWTAGTPDTSGFLQASRLGSGTGRVYTLTYQGEDNAGNTATCATTVTVPHDQGK